MFVYEEFYKVVAEDEALRERLAQVHLALMELREYSKEATASLKVNGFLTNHTEHISIVLDRLLEATAVMDANKEKLNAQQES